MLAGVLVKVLAANCAKAQTIWFTQRFDGQVEQQIFSNQWIQVYVPVIRNHQPRFRELYILVREDIAKFSVQLLHERFQAANTL
jgi:hypothetical protein